MWQSPTGGLAIWECKLNCVLTYVLQLPISSLYCLPRSDLKYQDANHNSERQQSIWVYLDAMNN